MLIIQKYAFQFYMHSRKCVFMETDYVELDQMPETVHLIWVYIVTHPVV